MWCQPAPTRTGGQSRSEDERREGTASLKRPLLSWSKSQERWVDFFFFCELLLVVFGTFVVVVDEGKQVVFAVIVKFPISFFFSVPFSNLLPCHVNLGFKKDQNIIEFFWDCEIQKGSSIQGFMSATYEETWMFTKQTASHLLRIPLDSPSSSRIVL